MIVLDENFPESQRQLLRGWRFRIHQVGYEVGRKGRVIRISHTGISEWRLHAEEETFSNWGN